MSLQEKKQAALEQLGDNYLLHPSNHVKRGGLSPALVQVLRATPAHRATNTSRTTSMSDPINHPKHYTNHPSGVECIQITEHMGFNLGNAVKYIWRADLKHDDPTEDLKKAVWYIEREIKRLGGKHD